MSQLQYSLIIQKVLPEYFVDASKRKLARVDYVSYCLANSMMSIENTLPLDSVWSKMACWYEALGSAAIVTELTGHW